MLIHDKVKRLKELFPDNKSFSTLYIENGPPGWFSEQDMTVYRELFEKIPRNGKVLEAGCFFGRSITSVADIIKNKNLQVFVVDTFAAHSWGGWEELKIASHYDTFTDILRHYKIYDNVCAFKHTSHMGSKFFDDGYFDFIFLDTDHSYECLSKEIKLYTPKLKSTGVIAGHDYLPWFGGVVKAVEEAYGGKVFNDAAIWVYPADWKNKN